MDQTQANPPEPTANQEKEAKAKRRVKQNIIALVVTIVFGIIWFYVQLPALNLQNVELYYFVILLCVVHILCMAFLTHFPLRSPLKQYGRFIKKRCKVSGILLLAVVAVLVVGSLISSVIFRASSYRQLLDVGTGDFVTDVDEISFSRIPMVDADSARQLGNRKLGELSDMVSQFEVSTAYTQINYHGRPVRVTPLEYGDIIKWFNNRSEGLPAYILVDMVSQEVDMVRLDEGIMYSPSELFSRDLNRHLRFTYPSYMFETPHLEIDEEGHPYWICPKIVKTIGLFGGTDISGAVIMDAVTGECTDYEAGDIPTWVDQVYMADLIIEQYDYYGRYVNGFINSILGQKEVTVTTEGYNYIALNDDVYMYTGITSAGNDQSNVGFILSNQRTKETKYYEIAGATEYSAMSSAEGVVQHLNYTATFPLLFNIDGQPTYFMSLKDNASLVKMYAMVNVEQYQIVATGTSVAACEEAYAQLLRSNNLYQSEGPAAGENTKEGVIAEIRTAVLEGDSWYYLRFEGDDMYYALSASSSELAVILDVGDRVSLVFAPENEGEIFRAYSIARVESDGTQTSESSPSPSTSPAQSQSETETPAA